jgi:hypothetical protein
MVGSSISRVRPAVRLRDLMTTYSSIVMRPSMRSRMACSRLSLKGSAYPCVYGGFVDNVRPEFKSQSDRLQREGQ